MQLKKHTQEIISLYNAGKTQQEIANIFHCSQTGISTLLKRNQVKIRIENFHNRKYTDVNMNFFDIIDSEAKAYFLGLMYADGCVQWNHNIAYSAILALKESDDSLIKKFRDLICPSYNIKYSQGKAFISIGRKKICEQLIELGCKPKKSLTLEFPTSVPNYLMHHFLRGVSDGDGTITKNKQKIIKLTGQRHINYLWKIVSSVVFCISMQEYLKREININSCISKFKTKQGPDMAVIIVGGNKQAYKALTWLYKDATIYLDRKYQRYLDLKNYIDNKYPELI